MNMKPDRKEHIQARIARLRELMRKADMQAYLVVSDDYHASEYVGDYFKCREYLSGFDGSAGSLVVTLTEAGLWTDGRYFLQAEEQLKGTGITLYRSGEEGVPEITEYLKEQLNEQETLGFDGRTVSLKLYEKLEKALKGKNIRIEMECDLAGEVWEDRPEISKEKVWKLADCYSGQSASEKLIDIRQQMKKKNIDTTIITSLDDIAWLFNIRGNDVAYCPVVLAYLILSQEKCGLYLHREVLTDEVERELMELGVEISPYETFYDDVQRISSGEKVLVDTASVNAETVRKIPDEAELVKEDNLTLLPKAKKNPVEVENERQAHLKDGVAVTRFIYWLKHHIGKEAISEMQAAEKLEEFRKQGSHYLGQSFAPIAAYESHGAIVHYEATEETDIPLLPESFLLLDTGGHYLEGTTDITRTIALGTLTEEQKRNYTAVLRGNLNLAAAKFKYGCHGVNLDYLAREPLWELGMDFNHGTGHGVGYLLNVHEGPNAIRYREPSGDTANQVLEEGMITSDEPGLYLTGQYGIRLENMILCKKSEKNEFGQFMEFETLTMVPFDLEAVEVSYMSDKEKERLNSYHKKVYDSISPYLSEEEKIWLKEATREI